MTVADDNRESPLKKAKRIVAETPNGRTSLFSYNPRPATLATYERMGGVAILPDMMERLENAVAPEHVCRWVAWGKTFATRIIRMTLALYIRRSINPRAPAWSATGKRWLSDVEKGCAERIFLDTDLGKKIHAWIGSNIYSVKHLPGGKLDPAFWNTVDKAVRSTSLETWWAEINKRVAKKPKRKRKSPFNRPTRTSRRDELKSLLRSIRSGDVERAIVKTLSQKPRKRK